jgi:hypothetical protein
MTHNTTILFLVIAALYLVSCSKDNDKCVGECATVTISGQVVDTPILKGISNIPVKIYLRSGGPGIGVVTKDIALTTSDKQGNFAITVSIDKSLFPRYQLYIEPVLSETYISSFYPGANNYKNFEQYQSEISNLRFTLHPKAILKIELRNTQNQTFNDFSLSYSYSTTLVGRFDHYGLPPLRDTILSMETAANIYTRIFWSKTYSPGQTSYFSDSITCNATGNNTYVLNY